MSKEPNRNVYVGHRYVPKIMGEWDKQTDYEGLSIVTYQGTSYTSKKRVPVGIDILNDEFWVVTGNYNAQVDYYRQETERVSEDLLLKSDQSYVDTELNKKLDTSRYNTEIENVNDRLNNNILDLYGRGVNVKFPEDNELSPAVGDGVTDDTEKLQSLIDRYTNVYIPDGTYMINPEIGLTMKDNQTIEFSNNAWLKNLKHDLTGYEIITMNGKNQTLLYPNIDGSRYDNDSLTGEHGHGISMRGSINPKIIQANIIDCWGDGIYIGSGSPHWCENVYIDRPICDNNRRQGISVTSVKGLRILNPILKNTNGTDPQTGIDFEPNNPESHMQDVKLVNPYLENNANQGIIIALHNMTGSENVVDITIENPYCVEDSIAVAKTSGNFKGKIDIINPVIVRSSLLVRDYDKSSAEVNIIRPLVIDSNFNNYEQDKYSSAINVMYDTNDDVSNVMGNVNIIEPTVIDTGNYYPSSYAIYVNDGHTGRNKPIENVNIINPKRLDGKLKMSLNATQSMIKDDNDILVASPTSGSSYSGSNVFKKINNKNLDSAKNMTLKFPREDSHEITFEMVNENPLIINPGENEVILPVSNTPGQSIRSETAGSSITIKKINATTWIVTNQIGTWN